MNNRNSQTDPAATSDEPLQAHTLNEVRYYLMVAPCPSCGKGPRDLDEVESPIQPGRPSTIRTRCKHCNQAQDLLAVCQVAPSDLGSDTECINPTDSPSRIIDLGQWLSLFYLLVESAAAEKIKPAVRLKGYMGTLCLMEALKFYGDNELPPEQAFFSEATAGIFHEHPEKFAKQRLRDMQSKLPAASKMRSHLVRDEGHTRRRWWKFWQR